MKQLISWPLVPVPMYLLELEFVPFPIRSKGSLIWMYWNNYINDIGQDFPPCNKKKKERKKEKISIIHKFSIQWLGGFRMSENYFIYLTCININTGYCNECSCAYLYYICLNRIWLIITVIKLRITCLDFTGVSQNYLNLEAKAFVPIILLIMMCVVGFLMHNIQNYYANFLANMSYLEA